MITGLQILQARRSIGWERKDLAKRAKVPVSVVMRAETSVGEPSVTIAQLNALMQALRTAGASFPPPATEAEATPSGEPAGSQAPINDV